MYKAKKILTSVIIALLVLTSVFCIIVVGYNTDWFSDFEKSESEVLSSGGLVVTVDEEHNDEVIQSGSGIFIDTVRLSSEGVEVVGNTYVKRVSATVLPDNEENRTALSWTLRWGNNPKEQSVDQFVNIDVLEDNITCDVICSAGFEGSTIILEVRSLLSNLFATCLIEWEGAPTAGDSYFVENSETIDNWSSIDMTTMEHVYDIVMSNPLGVAGSQFNDFEIETISLYGKINLLTYNVVNGVRQNEKIQTVDFTGWSTSCGYYVVNKSTGELSDNFIPITYEDFFTAEIIDGKLHIDLMGDETTYTDIISGAGSAHYAVFESVVNRVYFTVNVREKVSGVTLSLSFDPVIVAVTLSGDSIIF